MDIFCPLLLDAMALLLTSYRPRSFTRSFTGGLCDGRCLLEKVMFIENIQLDRDGEWEKEKKKMTACGARNVVVDASSTTKNGWRFRLIF